MLRAAAATPHLILFLADDLGLGDRSEHGPPYQDRVAPRLKHHTASDAEGPDWSRRLSPHGGTVPAADHAKKTKQADK